MSDIVALGNVKFTGGVICGNCNYHITESNAATCIEVAGTRALMIVCPKCGHEYHQSLRSFPSSPV